MFDIARTDRHNGQFAYRIIKVIIHVENASLKLFGHVCFMKPAVTVASGWFHERKGLAMAIVLHGIGISRLSWGCVFESS